MYSYIQFPIHLLLSLSYYFIKNHVKSKVLKSVCWTQPSKNRLYIDDIQGFQVNNNLHLFCTKFAINLFFIDIFHIFFENHYFTPQDLFSFSVFILNYIYLSFFPMWGIVLFKIPSRIFYLTNNFQKFTWNNEV